MTVEKKFGKAVYVVWEHVLHEDQRHMDYPVEIYSTYVRAAARVELLNDEARKLRRRSVYYDVQITEVKD